MWSSAACGSRMRQLAPEKMTLWLSRATSSVAAASVLRRSSGVIPARATVLRASTSPARLL